MWWREPDSNLRRPQRSQSDGCFLDKCDHFRALVFEAFQKGHIRAPFALAVEERFRTSLDVENA
jgi:hypothetical protein